MNPLLVFSKFSPNASRSDDLIVTLGSRRMFAGALPSGKKRQPAVSSSLLILIRAVASLADTLVPVSASVMSYNAALHTPGVYCRDVQKAKSFSKTTSFQEPHRTPGRLCKGLLCPGWALKRESRVPYHFQMVPLLRVQKRPVHVQRFATIDRT